LPEFRASPWFALFAPRGTPRPILDKLTDALDKAPALERLRNAINAEAAKEPSRFWATVQEYVNSLLVKAGVA